ncbi:MAG: peptidylprolyl isomerase [Anaerolineales bacterium]|nr:peptidylprolyl isomerase [Anaerolineales bacterium]
MDKKSFNLTPKNLIGAERDRFYSRLLTYGTILVVLLVIGLVGFSIVREKYIIPNQTVAEVEGVEITGSQYQQRVRLNRIRLVNTFIQYYQMQSLVVDPSFQQQLYVQLLGIQQELTPLVTGETTLNELIDDELLKLAAAERGITVSEADVERELQSFFGYFPQGTPTAAPTNTPYVTPTYTALQMDMLGIAPTAEAEEGEATAVPTATATAAPLPTSAPIPTATPVTEEGYRLLLDEYLASQTADAQVSEQAIREAIYAGLLRDAFRKQMEQDVPRTEEQVWARHILVATEAEAQDVLDRLGNGEDWAAIAMDVSMDTANRNIGGDLGWFHQARMVAPFAEAAFALKVGDVSEPVQTDFGWHVIQVLGHQDMPVSTEDFQQRVYLALDEYLAGLRETYTWEIIGERWKAATPDKPGLPIL